MHPYGNQSGGNRAQQAAQALASSLNNPYHHSSHYAQAYYSQPTASSSTQMTTPDGYSLSAAYVPSLPAQPQHAFSARGSGRGGRGSQHSRGGVTHNHRGQQQTLWYEPGDHRCTHEQCAFTGSKKSLEIHMMDRHLIYPPGWDRRKRKQDWDADPSLKNGKPIPIQGTSVILDTPEAVDAWIAERKKRWPTASRVEDRDKKLKDAIERGEIAASDPSLRGRKRPRTDDVPRGRGQVRGRGRGRGGHEGAQAPQARVVHALPMKPVVALPVKAVEADDDSSSSGSDMDPEKDAVSSKPPPGVANDIMKEEEVIPDVKVEIPKDVDVPPQSIKPVYRKLAPQPKVSQRNPYANRPSLLRNLLLPEIRMTVSNLSQAIHFLVENDFLQNVELNPGDADNKPIEVISETTHETSQPMNSAR